MADEIPAELQKPKRMALTLDEIEIVQAFREAKTQHELEVERISSILHVWYKDLTKAPDGAQVESIGITVLNAGVTDLIARLSPSEPTLSINI